MYNPNFKVVEFDRFKSEAGLHTFTLSAKEWIEKTNAVGIYVQAGRYGGTYAHKDIAFEFGSAISPIFKLYLLKEYQRLKDAENDRLKLEWSAKRFLSKKQLPNPHGRCEKLCPAAKQLHEKHGMAGICG